MKLIPVLLICLVLAACQAPKNKAANGASGIPDTPQTDPFESAILRIMEGIGKGEA